jgi:hypothetical protein
MRQITEVLRLAAQSLSCRHIGQSVGISASTVQGYLKRAQAAGVSWPLPDDLDAGALEERLFASARSAGASHSHVPRSVAKAHRNRCPRRTGRWLRRAVRRAYLQYDAPI